MIIIVPNAPDDLELMMGSGNFIANRTDKVIESYFCFYSYSLEQSMDYTIVVTTGGQTFEIVLDSNLIV